MSRTLLFICGLLFQDWVTTVLPRVLGDAALRSWSLRGGGSFFYLVCVLLSEQRFLQAKISRPRIEDW